jgi:hypothetical protein
MTYDDSGARVNIDSLDELRVYVKQNESDEIRRRRRVREALRALDVLVHRLELMTRAKKCCILSQLHRLFLELIHGLNML